MRIALDKSLYARAGMSRGSLVRAVRPFLSQAFKTESLTPVNRRPARSASPQHKLNTSRQYCHINSLGPPSAALW